MLAIIAVVMSANVMAQSEKKECGKCDNCDKCKTQKCDKQKPDAKKMAQFMTERMTKEYELTDKQAEKLKKLNEKYAGKLRPMGGHKHGNMGGQRGGKPKMDGKRPSVEEMKQMKAQREAYNKELKSILTDEQYQKYEQQKKNRRPHAQKKD